MTIDNLEIQVNVKSEKAMQKLQSLTNMLKSIGSASHATEGIGKIDGILKSIAGINLSGINSGLRTLSRYLRDIASLDKRLASVASSLQKISRNKAFGGMMSGNASGEPLWLDPTGPLGGGAVGLYKPYVGWWDNRGGVAGNSLGSGISGLLGEGYIEGTFIDKSTKSKGIFDDIKMSWDGIRSNVETVFAQYLSGTKVLQEHNKAIRGNHRSVWQMLRTILLYSTVFRIMGELIKGVGEGLKNIAIYSKKANETMSAYNSLFIYAKNSVAASIYPILEMLLPLVQTLVMWFGHLANAINIAISALRGQTQTIVADETYWEDYLETTKAVQKSLLGIDQINKLGTNSNPDKMFKTIDIGASDIASSWGTILSVISALIAAKAFTKGIEFFTLFGSGEVMTAALTIGKTFAAGALFFDGLGAAVGGFMDIEKASSSIEDSLRFAAGFLEIGAGIAIILGGWLPLAIGAVVGLYAYMGTQGNKIKEDLNEVAQKGSDIIESWKSDGNGILDDIWNRLLSGLSAWFSTIFKLMGLYAEGIYKLFHGDWSGFLQSWAAGLELMSGFGPQQAFYEGFMGETDFSSGISNATSIPGAPSAADSGKSKSDVLGDLIVNIYDSDGDLKTSKIVSGVNMMNRRNGQMTVMVQ